MPAARDPAKPETVTNDLAQRMAKAAGRQTARDMGRALGVLLRKVASTRDTQSAFDWVEVLKKG